MILLPSYLFILFIFGCPMGLWDLSLLTRVEPGPPQWKCWVPTTGRPGNSLSLKIRAKQNKTKNLLLEVSLRILYSFI